MQSNQEILGILTEVSQGYAVLGDKRRATAYTNGIDTLQRNCEDSRIDEMTNAELMKLKGIGKSLAKSVMQIAKTGTCDKLKGIRDKGIPSLSSLIKVEGVGPVTAKGLWEDYQVTTLDELLAAFKQGKLYDADLKRRALKARNNSITRIPRSEMEAVLLDKVRQVAALDCVKRAEAAGSLRRKDSFVKDADIVVCVDPKPGNVRKLFRACREIFGKSSGGDKRITTSVRVGDTQRRVDIMIALPDNWGAALNHFTGNKAHNVQLRTMAKARGMKVNEYGIWSNGKRLGGEYEEDLFRLLGLAYVKPYARTGDENFKPLSAAERVSTDGGIRLDFVLEDAKEAEAAYCAPIPTVDLQRFAWIQDELNEGL